MATNPLRVIARRAYSQATRTNSAAETSGPHEHISNVLSGVLDKYYPTQAQAFTRPAPFMSFNPNNFFRPFQLSREFQSKRPVRPKRRLVGPGREARKDDVFLQLSIDPRIECDNVHLMSHPNFITAMGKIRSRAETGLTTRSQRLLTKAIKRAKMMGVIPMLSRRYFQNRDL